MSDLHESQKIRWAPIKALQGIFLIVYVPALCVLAVLRFLPGTLVAKLTCDPLANVDAPFYTGMISNIGILLWCSAAAICYFSAAMLWRHVRSREWASFFFFSGLIISILLVDDFFLFHEEVAPVYLHISEKFVYIVYLAIMSFYLTRFSRIMMQTEFHLLIFALGFFGLSIGWDVLSIV